MKIEYFSETRKYSDQIELYKALGWYNLPRYTDSDIKKAFDNSFYSVYAYDGRKLVGLGRIASDGLTVGVMSGICVRNDYRRKGIGEGIVKRLVYFCQSGKYQMNVQLFCEDSLKHWYAKLGFESYPGGMRKNMILPEDPCKLRAKFKEIYGLNLITDICDTFYWNDFDSFSEFRYSESSDTKRNAVATLFMTLHCSKPRDLTIEMDFFNVTDFKIGCQGIRTPLSAFDIINIKNEEGNGDMRYLIHSLAEDDISFKCESFHIVNVTENTEK